MKSIISFGIRQYAKMYLKKWDETVSHPVRFQQAIFKKLLKIAKDTQFGKEHHFDQINNYTDFTEAIPLRTYPDFLPYINKIMDGQQDILLPGKPKYFARSSGTTASIKHIPVYEAFTKNYSKTGFNIMFSYMRETKNYEIILGDNLLLQGSPLLKEINGIKIGRMSGISYYFMPNFLKRKQLPSYKTNIIPDWEEKVRGIVKESLSADVRILGGIPPWILMYFDYLSEAKQNALIKDIFPNLQLYIHGGANMEPFRQLIFDKIGKPIHTLDTYTATEGFLGFQESIFNTDMTLCSDSGVFYEFVKLSDYHKNNKNPKRCQLSEVNIDTDYVIVLSTMSGLWGYVMGDVIKFTSCLPYHFLITGRISQYTSMFGEHVTETEVSFALEKTMKHFDFSIRSFTVAPNLQTKSNFSHHEWWIEFADTPENMEAIASYLDQQVGAQNPLYGDLIKGKVISPAKIIPVRSKGFEQCFLADDKIDGQNKMPVVANDRDLVERLSAFRL